MPYDYNTSLPAYKEGKKDICRQKVFTAIQKLVICNNRQISEYLGWPINSVTGRTKELVDNNLVVVAMKGIDRATGRTVNWWKVKPIEQKFI